MENLFVYGTLKWEMMDGVMPQLMPYLTFVANRYVKGKLFDVDDYPGAVPATSFQYKITGQVLQIKAGCEKEILRLLDEYEGYNETDITGSLFRREKTTVYSSETENEEAWIYWFNKSTSGLTEIVSGFYSKE